MVDRVYQRNATETAPQPPSDPSVGYPTNGNPAGGIPATAPGAWWYHMITESLRKIVVQAGLTPDHEDLDQVVEALNALAPAQNIAVFDTAGTSTWTVPDVLKNGHRKAHVTVIGGGGGGGKTIEGSTIGGAGGSGAGAAIGVFDLAGVDTVDITVAAGGNGANTASGAGFGGSGGSSSFGAYLSATGGGGGQGSGGASKPGAGTGGSINVSGTPGIHGTSGASAFGGEGGCSLFGGGGRVIITSGAQDAGASGVEDGASPGAGGSGAKDGASGNVGGNGASGIVIVEW